MTPPYRVGDLVFDEHHGLGWILQCVPQQGRELPGSWMISVAHCPNPWYPDALIHSWGGWCGAGGRADFTVIGHSKVLAENPHPRRLQL